MPYKMDASGNWTYVASSGGSGKSNNSNSSSSSHKSSSSGNGNKKVRKTTSDTKGSLVEITNNETEELKYAEEANFTIIGDTSVKRGSHLKITSGVASRWMRGKWLVLETTHTIDLKGYKTDGRLGRIPYKEKSNTKKSNSKKSNSKSNGKSKKSNKSSTNNKNKSNNKKNTNPSKSDKSGSKWKMDASGKWHKVSK